ncbi:LOB domain-containing protein 31-like [Bidens hawaiensis]|uniref:LOB domain-containing protein 31-like n=1 Tax=Bidens hawaiensis TaxID=980011 RepID=UPI00404B41B4
MGGKDGGPCGACKFLRRKCVKTCVFAPYFDSDQGTAHFAAVHRVFGASNASKLLLRVPAHRRLDAVVSMCYEALSRVRDPVYGCMPNIFTLQQQVENLQIELAYIRAQVTILQHLHQPNPSPSDVFWSPTPLSSSTESLVHSEPVISNKTSLAVPTFLEDDTSRSQVPQESDLEVLAREFLTNYAPRADE